MALGGSARAAMKRDPQDYGAPKRGPSAPDALLWVPRIVLFPPWLVSEYLVRRPIGAPIRVAERQQWPFAIVAFFPFGARDQITLFPSALFDFGLKPSVGFNFGWDHFLTEPNRLRVHFGTWGPEWISAKVVDSY